MTRLVLDPKSQKYFKINRDKAKGTLERSWQIEMKSREIYFLTAAILSSLVSLTSGDTCRDFTFGDCGQLDFFETVNDVDEVICQRYCSEVFDDQCRFFAFDFEQKLCQVFNKTLESFSTGCQLVGGPPKPPVGQCRTNPCDVRTVFSLRSMEELLLSYKC